MNLLQKYRAEFPQTEFQTRPLRCPDGLTRLVSLAPWYWEKLEALLIVDAPSLEEITEFCLGLAHRAVEEEGWDFDHAFHELLMYYIFRNFNAYRNYMSGLANDNIEDCFS